MNLHVLSSPCRIQESALLLQLRSTCGRWLLAVHRACESKQEEGRVRDPPCWQVDPTIHPNQGFACVLLHREQEHSVDVGALL